MDKVIFHYTCVCMCVYVWCGCGCGCVSVVSGSTGKKPIFNAGDTEDTGSIPQVGRFPGGGNNNPLMGMKGAW